MLIIVSVVVLPVSTPLESRVIVVIVLSVSTPSGNEVVSSNSHRPIRGNSKHNRDNDKHHTKL